MAPLASDKIRLCGQCELGERLDYKVNDIDGKIFWSLKAKSAFICMYATNHWNVYSEVTTVISVGK